MRALAGGSGRALRLGALVGGVVSGRLLLVRALAGGSGRALCIGPARLFAGHPERALAPPRTDVGARAAVVLGGSNPNRAAPDDTNGPRRSTHRRRRTHSADTLQFLGSRADVHRRIVLDGAGVGSGRRRPRVDSRRTAGPKSHCNAPKPRRSQPLAIRIRLRAFTMVASFPALFSQARLEQGLYRRPRVANRNKADSAVRTEGSARSTLGSRGPLATTRRPSIRCLSLSSWRPTEASMAWSATTSALERYWSSARAHFGENSGVACRFVVANRRPPTRRSSFRRVGPRGRSACRSGARTNDGNTRIYERDARANEGKTRIYERDART